MKKSLNERRERGNLINQEIFIGFAPQDNPQIAIAVVVENAGFGSTWACPIASLLIEQYITKQIARPELYNRMSNSYPKEDE